MIIAILSTSKEIMMPCSSHFLLYETWKEMQKSFILSWILIIEFDYSHLYDLAQKYLEIK